MSGGLTNLPARLLDRLHPEALTGCLLWAGAQVDGYGSVWLDGRSRLVHKVVYEAEYGAVPAGLVLRHRCFTSQCAQPTHLRPGTVRENILDPDVQRTGSRTHCPAGHARTPENTRTDGRHCRPCYNEKSRFRRAERTAA